MIASSISEDVWRFEGNFLIAPDNSRWPAVSGPHGKGLLPEGKYRIGKAVILDSTVLASLPYKDSSGLAWWCPLEPLFLTKRTHLGIHPDGNVPGTKECIGITSLDTRELFERLRQGQGEILIVLYS